MLTNFADLADSANGTLVLGMILGAIKRALLVRRAAVNRGEACSAHLEFGELIKLDLYRVIGVALALSLCSAGLNMFS